MSFKIGIVGATGAVGQELIRLLLDRQFPVSELRLFASARSAGKRLAAGDKTLIVEEAKAEVFEGLDCAIFSASAGLSRQLAPEAAARRCVVIDNSSAFRMDPEVPLVVPEINPDAAIEHSGIIANPNCSTIVALMAMAVTACGGGSGAQDDRVAAGPAGTAGPAGPAGCVRHG